MPSIANGIFGWGAPHSEVAIYYLGKDGEKEELETILANMDPWGGTTTSTFLQAYIPSANGGKDLLDENGKIYASVDENFAIVTTYEYDTKGKLSFVHDANGNVLESYTYTYDGAGNITAAYKNGVIYTKKTLYTPAEAAAAVKEGKNNTVTLTFK